MNRDENIPKVLLVNIEVDNYDEYDDECYIGLCPTCDSYGWGNFTTESELQDKSVDNVGAIFCITGDTYCRGRLVIDPYVKPKKLDIKQVMDKYPDIINRIQRIVDNYDTSRVGQPGKEITEPIRDKIKKSREYKEKISREKTEKEKAENEYYANNYDDFYKEASNYYYLEYDASFILDIVDIMMTNFIADKKASTSDMEILFGMKYDYSNVTDQHIQIMKRLGMKYVGSQKPPKILTENIPCIKKYKDEFCEKKFNLSVKVDSFDAFHPNIPHPKNINFDHCDSNYLLMKCVSMRTGKKFNYILSGH